MRRAYPLLTVPVLGLACQDVPGPEPLEQGPAMQIVDGTLGGGHAWFHFLPPVVQEVPSDVGEFDPTFLPYLAVEICVWNAGACTGDPIARFTHVEGPGAERLHIGRQGDFRFYRANWRTDEFELDESLTYRARVTVQSLDLPAALGHVDIDLAKVWAEYKAVNREEFVGVLDGRTLPIVFVIEGSSAVTRKDYLNHCTVGPVQACGSVVLRTVSVAPEDPRTFFAGTKTLIEILVRDLQGTHPADNTAGHAISDFLIITGPPAPPGATLSDVQVAAGGPFGGPVGARGLCPFEDERVCVLVTFEVEVWPTINPDGIEILWDWSDSAGSVGGCGEATGGGGFAVVTCDRLGYTGWAWFIGVEANYPIVADELELESFTFNPTRPRLLCQPGVNCEEVPIKK